MATTKTDVFNLTIGILLLNKSISDADTDSTQLGRTLRKNWPIALQRTLADMDLDGTAEDVQLEIVATQPNVMWEYAYKYPDNCALLRRILSGHLTDNRYTFVERKVSTLDGEKVIFTQQPEAMASIQPLDVEIEVFTGDALMALAHNLALLSSNLIVGKGAMKLRETIQANYIIHKAAAQAFDAMENMNPLDPETESDFVAVRMS